MASQTNPQQLSTVFNGLRGFVIVRDIDHAPTRAQVRMVVGNGATSPAGAIPAPPVTPIPGPIPHGLESLGAQTVDGVVAVGVRTTQAIPAGAQGYDREIVVVTDAWTSPDLRITMLRKTSDPRTGESTFRIDNFSRMEPEITLFQPPAGWLIKQDTGSFSITYSKP
jgi:hypothetical protein